MELLKDKLILITGASSGMGKEISISLLKFHTKLLLVGRNESVLKQISNERDKIAEVTYAKVDLSDDMQLDSFIDYLKNSAIEPDIMIHCAGIFHFTSIADTSNEMMDEAYKVNFRAPFVITRDLLEIIKRKKAQVIFVNSTASLNPKPNLAAYSSTKAALKTFAEVLHQEVYPFGVRVMNIYPGRVATPMQEEVCKLEGRKYTPDNFISVKTIADTVLNLISLPLNVEISEIIIRPTT